MPLNLRVLHLYNRVPHPPRDGGVKAVLQMRQVLEDLGCKVRGFVLNPSRNRIEPASLPDSLRANYLTDIVEVDSNVSIFGALTAVFSPWPYHLLRFKNAKVSPRLRQTIEDYRPDLVLVEGLPMALYQNTLRQLNCRVLYRSHNIESDIVGQKATPLSRWNPLRAWMLGEYRKMRTFEQQTIRTVDGVVAISPQDLIQIRDMAPEHPGSMIHFGYRPTMAPSLNTYSQEHPRVWDGQRPLRLGFIGTMDWLPNQDAVQWLLNEWIPSTDGWMHRPEFHVAGRKAPAGFAKQRPAYFFHGEVEDAAAFMAFCDAMVFPLRMGSGLKIKVLEAVALGIPVISTAHGVQGTGFEPGVDYWQAENPGQFAELLQTLQRSPQLLQEMKDLALHKIDNSREHQQQTEALAALLERIVSQNT
jgi:glycosyltransferase involved in cell wall biosynthesis